MKILARLIRWLFARREYLPPPRSDPRNWHGEFRNSMKGSTTRTP